MSTTETTIERAMEIAKSFYRPETGYNDEELYLSAMAMAEWKDKQFKQIVENYIKLAYDYGQEANLLEDLLKDL